LRVTSYILLAVLTPMSVAAAQLSGGFGPMGQLSSAESAWRTSASLWGTARYESSLSSSEISGQLTSGTGALRVGTVGARQQFFSPSLRGLRAITSLELGSRPKLDPRGSSELSATSSLSYRHGHSGAWFGVRTERSTTAALRMGGWRQLGSWLTVAISSSLRRGTYGGTGARTWTGTYRDTVLTDSGWVVIEKPGIFGDSGSPGRKLSWLETEANVGWTKGRLALDGAVGWRPGIDSTPRATWFRALTTIAVTKDVAVSAGAGTTMRQIPYARPTGRYATVAVRLAPAALVRPRETPEITPTATAFRLERQGDQYVVRIRLPRARVVELSGDFNGWQPVRLTRETDGTWVASLPLQPGAYRMNLRIDGERWLPPPGTPAVDDEFNGKVGLVIVR
jgi:hypothetical protein